MATRQVGVFLSNFNVFQKDIAQPYEITYESLMALQNIIFQSDQLLARIGQVGWENSEESADLVDICDLNVAVVSR